VNDRDSRDTSYSRALEICWLAIIFFIPLFFNPSSHQAFYLNKALLLQFIVIVMLAISLATWMSGKYDRRAGKWRSFIASPITLTVLLFGLIAVVATVVSITPTISFWGSYFRKAGLINLLCWILFFVIVSYNLRNREQLFRALYALLLSSAIVSVLGVLSSFFPGILLGYGHGYFRISSTIGNSLSLSNYLAMIIPINMAFIVWLLKGRIKRNNVFLFSGLVILLIFQFWSLLLAQYSVTILLYLIAPLIFIALFGIIQRKKLIIGFGSGFILIVGIIAGTILTPLFLNINEEKSNNSNEDVKYLISAESLELETVSRRIVHWKYTVDLVLDSQEVPFSNDRLPSLRTYIGYGPETYLITYQPYYPEDLDDLQSLFSPPLSRPHNHYLYLAVTTGLIGLVSFISIIIVFLWIAFRIIQRAKSLSNRLLLIALIAGVIQYSADSIFNPSTIASELVFWVNLSLVLVAGKVGLDTNNYKMQTEAHRTIGDKNTASSKSARLRSYMAAGCVALVIIIGINTVIRPFIADIQFQRGLQLQAIRDEGALTAYDKAVELEPKEAVYWSSIGAFSYSIALRSVSEDKKTEFLVSSTNAYEKALKLERYIASRYYPLADVYTFWAKDGSSDKWPRAMLLYDMASQLSPRNIIIFNKWAHALVVKGNLDQAREKLSLAKSMNQYWIGNALISALILVGYGQNEDAVGEVIASIQELPEGLRYCETIFYEMAVYDTLETLHKAFDTYTQSYPEEWIHHAMLGFTSLFSGDPNRSITEFDKAMHLVPDEQAGDLFVSIVNFAGQVPYISFKLPEVATEWRPKLSRTINSEQMIRMLDNITQ
jgi:tetratricopeptide (TPR) repeat protein